MARLSLILELGKTSMSIDQIEAVTAIERFIEPWLLGDIRKTILSKANYTAALALLTYTEILGGFKTGDLGLQGKSNSNFNAALELFEWDGDAKYYRNFRLRLN